MIVALIIKSTAQVGWRSCHGAHGNAPKDEWWWLIKMPFLIWNITCCVYFAEAKYFQNLGHCSNISEAKYHIDLFLLKI